MTISNSFIVLPFSKRAGQEFSGTLAGKKWRIDIDKLIDIAKNNKTISIPVNMLKHNLDEKAWGEYSINDVLLNPKKYPKEMKRIKEVKSFPILLSESGDLIDGFHRLAKATIEKCNNISARIVTVKQMTEAEIPFSKRK